ncbi:MAG TPA: alkyl hydroperoxide reductase [Elusimicrobia bacterium]|nr:alkyl hydroperoxide reductase [Elusimicrobiota bacterium]
MKKLMVILIGFAVLFSACKGKMEQREPEKKQEKSETNFDIGKRCATTVVPIEKKKIAEKTWGDAPDFTLPKIDGGTLTLSDVRGKLIILDFWATWCPPCKAEIPSFVQLQNEYNDKLAIIGVCLDEGDPGNVKKFIEKMQVNYPIVIGNNKVVADYGGIRGIPTTFIIAQNGDIKETIVGYRPKEVFENKIKALLKL